MKNQNNLKTSRKQSHKGLEKKTTKTNWFKIKLRKDCDFVSQRTDFSIIYGN